VFREFSSSQLKYFLKIIYFFFLHANFVDKIFVFGDKKVVRLGERGMGKVKSEKLKVKRGLLTVNREPLNV